MHICRSASREKRKHFHGWLELNMVHVPLITLILISQLSKRQKGPSDHNTSHTGERTVGEYCHLLCGLTKCANLSFKPLYTHFIIHLPVWDPSCLLLFLQKRARSILLQQQFQYHLPAGSQHCSRSSRKTTFKRFIFIVKMDMLDILGISNYQQVPLLSIFLIVLDAIDGLQDHIRWPRLLHADSPLGILKGSILGLLLFFFYTCSPSDVIAFHIIPILMTLIPILPFACSGTIHPSIHYP